tara:strand:+ start:18489 stop:20261 length:1773 start_codon:yes stop_codon:yes gene_type:complete
MTILKSLSKNYFFIFIIITINFNSLAEDKPVDIWNIDKKEIEDTSTSTTSVDEKDNNKKKELESNIYQMQSQKQSDVIELDENVDSKIIKIVGLYDPEDYGLDINMWSNSDGDQLKNIFLKLEKINLSEDAKEIMNISVLTNSYFPQKNISEKEFLKFKSDWLMKNSDLDLIQNYISKNQVINSQPKLTRYLIDQHLSAANIEKACEIFLENSEPINDNYLSKFNIYCLIESGKKEEAQIIFDLKKELGFEDKYFEKKIAYLLGYSSKIDETISEKSIFDFYLAHKTNPDFFFEPKKTTDKIIWKYLAASNLLSSFKEIEISELDKISNLELATHNKNYPEKDLLEIYKRFQFNFDQLLNAENSYKSLDNIEARALIYQKILLVTEMKERLRLLKILKNLFKKDKINNAFDVELKKFLDEMDPLNIPDNLTSFYYTNIQIKKEPKKKIKFNNDILHQSKLLNYFNGDYSKSKIEKDLNNFLKKIKKNKKYLLSKKDIIFLDSLRSDGVKIDKKFDNLYEVDTSEIPTDIQVMINNNEKGAALLRIVQVIGEDELERIDEDTMYFIISTLNQLNIGLIRNQILLKVLPLKV